ncbi:MAG: hypothetical protein ACTSYA_13495 [Candidatus Kariarchaeaceae archaeon]
MDYTVLYSFLNFYLEFWIIALVFRAIVFITPMPIRTPIEYVGLKARLWVQKTVLQGLNIEFYEEEEFVIEHSKMDSFGHLVLIYLLVPAFLALYIGPILIVYGFTLWSTYQMVSLLFTIIGFSLLSFTIPTAQDLAKIGNASGKSTSIWFLKGLIWATFIEVLAQAELLHDNFLWLLLAIGILYPGRSMDLELINPDFGDLMTTVSEVK